MRVMHHLQSHGRIWSPDEIVSVRTAELLTPFKMFETLLMSSTTIIRTIRKTMFTELAEQDVLAAKEPPSPSSPPTVCCSSPLPYLH